MECPMGNLVADAMLDRVKGQGVEIAIQNGGVSESFTVRKISNGGGVERIFPFASPRVAKVEVVRYGRVRRAKLYYLRGLRGKAARITERRRS